MPRICISDIPLDSIRLKRGREKLQWRSLRRNTQQKFVVRSLIPDALYFNLNLLGNLLLFLWASMVDGNEFDLKKCSPTASPSNSIACLDRSLHIRLIPAQSSFTHCIVSR